MFFALPHQIRQLNLKGAFDAEGHILYCKWIRIFKALSWKEIMQFQYSSSLGLEALWLGRLFGLISFTVSVSWWQIHPCSDSSWKLVLTYQFLYRTLIRYLSFPLKLRSMTLTFDLVDFGLCRLLEGHLPSGGTFSCLENLSLCNHSWSSVWLEIYVQMII